MRRLEGICIDFATQPHIKHHQIIAYFPGILWVFWCASLRLTRLPPSAFQVAEPGITRPWAGRHHWEPPRSRTKGCQRPRAQRFMAERVGIRRPFGVETGQSWAPKRGEYPHRLSFHMLSFLWFGLHLQDDVREWLA